MNKFIEFIERFKGIYKRMEKDPKKLETAKSNYLSLSLAQLKKTWDESTVMVA